MRLSAIPDNVKKVLLATCDEDVALDDMQALTRDELLFVAAHACGLGAVLAHMTAPGGAISRSMWYERNPFRAETIELDEPLPALTRDSRLKNWPETARCVGWKEAHLRFTPVEHTRDELLRARYEDTFCRELHFGWPVPDFDEWAAKQP